MIREKEISFYISHYNTYPSSIMQLTAKVLFGIVPHVLVHCVDLRDGGRFLSSRCPQLYREWSAEPYELRPAAAAASGDARRDLRGGRFDPASD